MKKFNWKTIKRTASVGLLKLKKHSPQILVVTGCAGAVAGTVIACKKTLQLDDTLDEAKAEIEAAKSVTDEEGNVDKKELTKAYAKGVGKVAKLYAPAIIVEATSIGMIFCSSSIMKKRNAQAAAAYATLDQMYRRYRKNVIEKYGEEEDRNLRYGIKKETIEEVITDEKGKSKVVKKDILVADPGLTEYSEYARWFDESCNNWDKDPEYSLMFLNGVEAMCNRKLRANGYLFLNDVYSAIGIPETWAGQFVGWIYDAENPLGDNQVRFGVYRDIERNRAFVNGSERNILLDFNVDGDICNDERLKLYMPVI